MKKHIYDIAERVILFRLLYNCELMYDYLTETGKNVPEDIGTKLSVINLKTAPIIAEYKAKKESDTADGEPERVLRVAIAKALEGDKETITNIFNELVSKCKPATPCTLENTIPTDKMFIWFGSKFIRFIRDVWLLSIFFLAGYVITGSFSVIKENQGDQFYLQLLLFFSAGLGACLYALTTSKRYIIARTFDNKYITHYYNRIIIGLITGFILANIIDASFFTSNAAGQNIVEKITPSLLALLGGFSAEAVIKILNRIVAMITTLVEGDVKDLLDTKEQEIKSRFQAQKVKQNMDSVIDLKSILESSKINKDSDLYKKIDGVINKMMEETS